MENNADKSWSTEEIRSKAGDWTLAGDVGLLSHLETFSQNFINRIHSTKKALDELEYSFDQTNSDINNVTNQFLALQNNQFVENRVYEDETPTEDNKTEVKPSEIKQENEQSLLVKYKETVEIGVKLLDSHFEQVELPPGSDSEDDSPSSYAYGWRPINPYLNKPFPFLIGSTDWWSDDTVGLGEPTDNPESDIESEEEEEDVEEERIEKRARFSSTSEDELTESAAKKQKMPFDTSVVKDEPPTPAVTNTGGADNNGMFEDEGKNLFGEANNLFDNSYKNIFSSSRNDGNLFSPDDEDKNTSYNEDIDDLFSKTGEVAEASTTTKVSSVGKHRLNNDFTKELKVKLGSVVEKQKHEDTISPISKNEDDHDKSALTLPNKQNNMADMEDGDNALFSNKQTIKQDSKLFDDGVDELFGDSKLFVGQTKSTAVVSATSQGVVNKSNITSSLFDEEDDDGGLFSSTAKIDKQSTLTNTSHSLQKSSALSSSKANTTSSKVDDLFSDVSGINETNNSSSSRQDVANNAHIEHTSSDLGFEDNSLFASSLPPASTSTAHSRFEPEFSSTRSLSADTSDYKTQISTTMNSNNRMGRSQTERSTGLFANEDDDGDLFSKKPTEAAKKVSLFDEDELFTTQPSSSLFTDTNDDSSLFKDSLSKNVDNVSISSSRSSLFDEISVGKSTLPSIFDKKEPSDKRTDFNKKQQNKLFGDIRDEDEDLFAITSKPPSITSSDNSKKQDLFGDKSDLLSETSSGVEERDGLFDSPFTSKSKISLKPVVDDSPTDDLFKTERISKNDAAPKSKDGVRSAQEGDVDDLFSVTTTPKVSAVTGKLFSSSSDDLFASSTKLNAEVDKTKSIFKDAGGEDLFGSSSKTKSFKDDLFHASASNSVRVEKESKATVQSKGDLFGVESKSVISDDLFVSLTSQKHSSDPLGTLIKSESTSQGARSVEQISTKELIKIEKNEADLFGVAGASVAAEKPASPPRKLVDEVVKSETALFGGSDAPMIAPKPPSPLKNPVTTEITKEIKKPDVGLFGESPSKSEVSQSSSQSSIGKDDLFGKSDINTKKEIAKSVIKPKNIFTDTSSDDGSLFGADKPPTLFNSQSKSIKTETKVTKSKMFASEEDEDLFGAKTMSQSEQTKKPEVTERKAEPPKSLDIKSNHSSSSEVDGASVSTVKPQKIGKLNIPKNLNINPTALLPGAKLKQKVETPQPEGNVFDQPVKVSENLLPHADRVKIQVKRRPQSRKARQEALRTSGIDFGNVLDDPDGIVRSKSVEEIKNEPAAKKDVLVKTESFGTVFHSIENSPEPYFASPLPSNPLSPSTDEEDYFNVPELDSNLEKDDNLFNSKTGSENVFNQAPVLSPHDETKSIITKQNLFDEESDDFFVKTSNKLIKVEKTKKTNLFDSDDVQDDDLFGGSAKPTSQVFKKVEKTVPKSKSKNDEEKNKNFVDPLGLMQ